MTDNHAPASRRASELAHSNPGADALPAGSYWEAHRYLGVAPLSPESRVQVNTVLKEGAWYVRLRAYRRVQRGSTDAWIPARQTLIL